MIIPRAKKEAQSELKFSLQIPLTVNTDADSEFAVEIISEMAPYLDPVHSEAFDSAVSIEIRPQISLKNEFYSISIKDNKIKIIAKDKRGASVPTGFNMFDNILCDFILGYNDCNIFKADANLKKFKNTLTSLTAISKDQSKLISAYLELL